MTRRLARAASALSLLAVVAMVSMASVSIGAVSMEPVSTASVSTEMAAGARPGPFVFATARYESGDWNAAPLVPTNVIHSIAQYTAIPVAPQGATVDLSSPELFRFPFVYLTGHLPVRFSQQESANLKAYVERGGFVFVDEGDRKSVV